MKTNMEKLRKEIEKVLEIQKYDVDLVDTLNSIAVTSAILAKRIEALKDE